MTRKKAQGVLSKDEVDIRKLIERWAKAVRDGDRTGICEDHVPDILMFDVPPPLVSQGLDSYMATWERFLSWSEKPVTFDFHDVRITAGKDVAFATALGRCTGGDANSKREELEFRLTICFRKIGDRWHVLHEHHSLPAS
jgi:uncharacterized protein (TIGR02246 family)